MSNVKELLTSLRTEVAETKALSQSAIALLKGISQMLKDAVANNQDLESLKTELGQITTELDTDNTAFAQALIENTPQAAETATPPVVEEGTGEATGENSTTEDTKETTAPPAQ